MNIRKQFIHGFTIVELLIVIAIIGILTTIVAVSYVGIQGNAVAVSLQSDLSNASDFLRIDQAHSGTGSFPTSLAAGNGGKGIPASSGTSYPSYVFNNNTLPHTFCLTATKSGQNYFITQEGTPMPGVCPVLYLDAGTTTSYPGTGTAWNDLSGNGNNGTIYGGVTYNNSNGGILSFDGSSGYVDCGNNSIFDNINQITINAWIKWPSSATKEIIIKSNSTNTGVGPYEFFQNGNGVTFRTTKGGTSIDLSSAATISSNSWTNITAVWDGTKKYIYINGVKDINTQSQSSPIDASTGKLVIGAYANGQYPFNGFISAVNIYNRALSATEVQQNFNSMRSRYGL